MISFYQVGEAINKRRSEINHLDAGASAGLGGEAGLRAGAAWRGVRAALVCAAHPPLEPCPCRPVQILLYRMLAMGLGEGMT